MARSYNIPTGAYVESVDPDSAAARAGIREGDIITSLDGTAVNSALDLKNLVSHYSDGDSVDVTVVSFSIGSAGQGNENYRTTTVHVTFGTEAQNNAA